MINCPLIYKDHTNIHTVMVQVYFLVPTIHEQINKTKRQPTNKKNQSIFLVFIDKSIVIILIQQLKGCETTKTLKK